MLKSLTWDTWFSLLNNNLLMFQLLDLCFADLKMHQRESCELSFIWGKMRTIVWETAFQIALRNCSKEVEGRSAYMWFGSRHHHEEMWCFSRHEKMQQLSSQNQFLKIYNYLKTCSANFFRARNASFLNSLQQILKASSCSSMCDLILVEVDRKCTWQVPTGS